MTPATRADLDFVVRLQKRYGEALGFLPRAALAEKIGLGQVLVARRGRRRVGFLHHGSLARPEVRVFQAAVEPGARRHGVAMAMLRRLLARARHAGARGVSLRCLEALEANAFWAAARFELLTKEAGARGALNVWVKRLRRSRVSFSSRVHPCPRCGARTVGTWTRGARRVRSCSSCARLSA